MPLSFSVTFDAHDPVGLARFWALALEWIEQPPPEGFASWDDFADSVDMPVEERNNYGAVINPEDPGKRILFLRVPEVKTAKNRVHLDVNAGGGREVAPAVRAGRVEAHVTRLVAAGAAELARHDEYGTAWVVMADPEGNEFCVV
jgi:hypothetical protein